jgi:hypothetical protein
MDMFILVRMESFGTGCCELVGVWDKWQDAQDVMASYYENDLAESEIPEDEQRYACLIEDSYAQICDPHDRGGIKYYIFEGFNDALINR